MKKKIFLAVFITIGLNSLAQDKQSKIGTSNDEIYTPLTENRYNQIEDLLTQNPEFNPIKIDGIPREELIKFYIKIYNDEFVSTWMDNAYKKMRKTDLVEVGSIQDNNFKKLIKLEQNRANMFKFMSIMTDDQITAIAY